MRRAPDEVRALSSRRWQQIKSIVDAALDRETSERPAFLDEACRDPELRKEVESLLAHELSGFLEEPAAAQLDAPEEPARATPMDLTGRTLAHYKIEEKLGEGGMGAVFLAQDQSLERFLREAKSAAALDHPYICKVYEIGAAEGRSFIAMEYVRGETLEHRIRRERLSMEEAGRIAAEISEALDTAHREDIVHRDLKPANIMLTPGGHVKVLDFGLAKRVVSQESADSQVKTASELTGEGLTLGTLTYMSPEQVRRQPVDARSDIFSLGIVLYEMYAGTHPFRRPIRMDTAVAIVQETPPPLSDQRREVPELLNHIVAKMLAKAPEERYQLIRELRADLRRLQDGTAAVQRFPGRWVPTLPNNRLLVVVFVVIALAALWTSTRSPSGPETGRGELLSVAVLPLTNISDDPEETDYLADGISQAVTNKLTQVGLRVTPWETASRYRERRQPPQVVARELNVDAVLVGTFQISGDQVLTSVSLVEAESGFQSWADTIVETVRRRVSGTDSPRNRSGVQP